MTAGILDHITRRQAEVGQLLAACASVQPVETLAAIKGLKPALIIDLDARRYLKALAARRNELEQADLERQAEISVEVAWALGIQLSLNRWLGRAIDTGIDRDLTLQAFAVELVTELKRLAITHTEVNYLLADLAEEGIAYARI